MGRLSFAVQRPIFRSSKPDIQPDFRKMECSMKNMFFAALAALSLSAAVVPAYAASTIGGDAAATRMQQTGSYGGGD
jgi:hypothetical protein